MTELRATLTGRLYLEREKTWHCGDSLGGRTFPNSCVTSTCCGELHFAAEVVTLRIVDAQGQMNVLSCDHWLRLSGDFERIQSRGVEDRTGYWINPNGNIVLVYLLGGDTS